MRVYFYKEQLENSSKKELQKGVNRMIKSGLLSPNTRVVYDKPLDVNKYNERMKVDQTIYMNSEVWEALWETFDEQIEDIEDGFFSKADIIALALSLKARVHPTDNETMEQIRQLVENKENN